MSVYKHQCLIPNTRLRILRKKLVFQVCINKCPANVPLVLSDHISISESWCFHGCEDFDCGRFCDAKETLWKVISYTPDYTLS